MSVPTPAMPASNAVVTNTTGQWVSVAITGGTLTVVNINGTQAGTTAGNYQLPPNGTIFITYSVAPTWAWTNPIDLGYTPGYYGTDSAAEAAGYNPYTVLPYAQHAVAGASNLGTGVSN